MVCRIRELKPPCGCGRRQRRRPAFSRPPMSHPATSRPPISRRSRLKKPLRAKARRSALRLRTRFVKIGALTPGGAETQNRRQCTTHVMNTTTPTFRWIAATLTAVMLLGPLAPTLEHACVGMSAMSGHGSMASPPAHVFMSDASTAAETGPAHHASSPAHHAAHSAVAPVSTVAQVSSSTSHDCPGPCAGSDCCSMKATPVSHSDGFLAERVQSVTLTAPAGAERFTPLFARADRAPPRPPQPDISPSLLSARLHVWMATYLT